MTRLVHAGTAALALATLSLIAPSRAAARGLCAFSIDFTASPGISTTPSTGIYTFRGPTGTISCLGTIDGHWITGPGRCRNRARNAHDPSGARGLARRRASPRPRPSRLAELTAARRRASADVDRPTLFGRAFDGPMLGHASSSTWRLRASTPTGRSTLRSARAAKC